MQDDLNKFEKLVKGERKPTVGVFRCPGRGKSTLLNVLLGVDMLPMKGKPGTTRFGIELSYKNTKEFKIEVQGPFCSFLGKDIVFIDTLGVELGASNDDTEKGSPVDHDFMADTNRALAILSSVDVVIFCMTNKYKEKKDADFYNDAIRDKYEPINVITAGDKRDDGEINKDIKQKKVI
jgi:GTPase Era involved in 16S rRNA processing